MVISSEPISIVFMVDLWNSKSLNCVGVRNWEYISGEDPYLGYLMGAHAVSGMQSQNVMANVKHFVGNN
jgi:hypothetical protein